MRKVMKTLVVSFCFLFGASLTMAQSWKLGVSHKISFSSSDVSGIFKELTGSVSFNTESLGSSRFDFKIRVESINTGNGMMNNHAKGEEWFNAEKYPYISFTSSKFEKTDTGYKVLGTLEIKGIKKELTIPFTFVKLGNKANLSAKFTVDRTVFGVGKKSEDVSQTLSITALIPLIQ